MGVNELILWMKRKMNEDDRKDYQKAFNFRELTSIYRESVCEDLTLGANAKILHTIGSPRLFYCVLRTSMEMVQFLWTI